MRSLLARRPALHAEEIRAAFDLKDPLAQRNLAAHFPAPDRNRLVVVPGTGHTYQRAERETAARIAELLRAWSREWETRET